MSFPSAHLAAILHDLASINVVEASLLTPLTFLQCERVKFVNEAVDQVRLRWCGCEAHTVSWGLSFLSECW